MRRQLLIAATTAFLSTSATASLDTVNFTVLITDIDDAGVGAMLPFPPSIGDQISGSFVVDTATGFTAMNSFFDGNIELAGNSTALSNRIGTFNGTSFDIVESGNPDFGASFTLLPGQLDQSSAVFSFFLSGDDFHKGIGHLTSFTESVPDSGTTLLLFGLGLIGIGLFCRKLAETAD